MSTVNTIIESTAEKGRNKAKKAGNLSYGSDICRMVVVNYTRTGGRRMNKPKLNFRFHGSDSTEALSRQLLRVCIDANMNRVERIMREGAAFALDDGDNKEESNYENP